MKKRLENLGEVNPTAIEAFDEMKKRYDFILEQKNDLVSAKESLLQTIQEVEATANQRFLETFNKVRENFQRVFKAKKLRQLSLPICLLISYRSLMFKIPIKLTPPNHGIRHPLHKSKNNSQEVKS